MAANRSTIVNSDAALDLADVAPDARRSALSTPLLNGDTLVGVLTVYADAPNTFAEEQGRMLQMVAPHLARMLSVCRPGPAKAATPIGRVLTMTAKTELRAAAAR